MCATLYEIGNTWSSNKNTDVQLNVHVGNKHFQINLSAANFEASPKLLEEYLFHVEHSDPEYLSSFSSDNDGTNDDSHSEDEGDPLEAFYHWAMEPLLPVFREIPALEQNRRYTLHECLLPKTVTYTLRAIDDVLIPHELENVTNTRPLGVLLPQRNELLAFQFPVIGLRDVHITMAPGKLALPTQLGKVCVGKDTYFFKQLQAGDIGMAITELSTFTKIRSANFKDEVKVSQLLGIVKDEETSRVVGLLISYIERGTPLSCDPRCLTDSSLCKKWLKQITHSLDQLHAHQITWGDAKPDNVLISKQDDAYLIDFGGGYTPNWVDQELANTVEGDRQGLERIAKFLNVLK